MSFDCPSRRYSFSDVGGEKESRDSLSHPDSRLSFILIDTPRAIFARSREKQYNAGGLPRDPSRGPVFTVLIFRPALSFVKMSPRLTRRVKRSKTRHFCRQRASERTDGPTNGAGTLGAARPRIMLNALLPNLRARPPRRDARLVPHQRPRRGLCLSTTDKKRDTNSRSENVKVQIVLSTLYFSSIPIGNGKLLKKMYSQQRIAGSALRSLRHLTLRTFLPGPLG